LGCHHSETIHRQTGRNEKTIEITLGERERESETRDALNLMQCNFNASGRISRGKWICESRMRSDGISSGWVVCVSLVVFNYDDDDDGGLCGSCLTVLLMISPKFSGMSEDGEGEAEVDDVVMLGGGVRQDINTKILYL